VPSGGASCTRGSASCRGGTGRSGRSSPAREERDQYILEVLLLDGDVALRLSVASERLDLVENGAVRHHDSAICQQQQQPASDLRSC
jgi:hypothetical protein